MHSKFFILILHKSRLTKREQAQQEGEWAYAIEHTSPQDAVLYALERETYLKSLFPQMLSGAYQGRILQMFSQMIQPQRILEIGTFTGYSSICLARGLDDAGLLHTIEVNEESVWFLEKFAARAGLSQKIIQHVGDAAEVIPSIDECFDLVFMDAGKLDYPKHYELALEKMKTGAFLLADNIMWDGKILEGKTDETTETLRQFNAMIQADERVENLLLPMGDGLMVVRKL